MIKRLLVLLGVFYAIMVSYNYGYKKASDSLPKVVYVEKQIDLNTTCYQWWFNETGNKKPIRK
jgi:hypothetical protein